MKKIKILLLAALGATVLVGCDSDGKSEPKPSAVIDFEAVEFAALTELYGNTYTDILTAKSKAAGTPLLFDDILYTEDDCSLGGYYSNDMWESWGGFAFSSQNDRAATQGEDYSRQFASYATSASSFAVGYDASGWNVGVEYDKPVILFDRPQTILSARFANTNVTYNHCLANARVVPYDPEAQTPPAEEPIWVRLIVTGYNGAAVVGEAHIDLASGGNVLANWTEVSLKGLGKVDRLVFSIDSNNENENGLLAPKYFCIDDIKIQ